jgi:hypothetical protein
MYKTCRKQTVKTRPAEKCLEETAAGQTCKL